LGVLETLSKILVDKGRNNTSGKSAHNFDMNNAKIIEWDIPDPKGKEIEEYHRTLRIIKEKIIKLLMKLEV
jgi:protein-tyrosine-phosphatase